MQYTRLGTTGLEVSRICIGCMSFGEPNRGNHNWSLSEADSRPIIRKAWEAGINFYDTANVYSLGSSEEITGKVLKELAPRSEWVLATKVHGKMREGPNGHGLSRKAILQEIDDSLRRLGTDYVDLYQIHRWDNATPIEETLEALNDVVRAGKARYIGASSMYAWQFAKALHASERNGWARFVSMQNHYNLVYREEEREMIPLCRDQGVGLIPWSPLARGFLAGNRTREKSGSTVRARTDDFAQQMYYQPDDFTVADRLQEVAREHSRKPTQIALAWILSRPGLTAPIIGASKMEHLDDAVAALEVKLGEADVKRLEEPYRPH